jgi:hypothetical protein
LGIDVLERSAADLARPFAPGLGDPELAIAGLLGHASADTLLVAHRWIAVPLSTFRLAQKQC